MQYELLERCVVIVQDLTHLERKCVLSEGAYFTRSASKAPVKSQEIVLCENSTIFFSNVDERTHIYARFGIHFGCFASKRKRDFGLSRSRQLSPMQNE